MGLCYDMLCKPKWRNWQTRGVQGAVGSSLCGFKSHLRHRRPGDFIYLVFFVCTTCSRNPGRDRSDSLQALLPECHRVRGAPPSASPPQLRRGSPKTADHPCPLHRDGLPFAEACARVIGPEAAPGNYLSPPAFPRCKARNDRLTGKTGRIAPDPSPAHPPGQVFVDRPGEVLDRATPG